jgi:hypothetical protein
MAKSAAAAAREISMNRIIIAVLLLLLFAATSFARNEKSANGANLLLQLEANFAADVAKHGHDAFLTYFAEDGVEIVDGGGINDKDAMRKQPPWPEGTTLTWTPVHAEMAASGDLGYTYGKYVYTAKIKRTRSLPTTASTPRSGKSRRTANGRWSSTWETPAPTREQGSEPGPSQAMRDPHRAPIVERMAAIRFAVVATSIP